MTDQILMDNYLLILKSTVEVYVHGTLESSNKEIKDLLKYCLDEIMTSQKNTYDEMVKNNWYVVKNIKSTVIKQTLNSILKKSDN